jgi:Tfp pilus assembly protein FimT
MVVVLTLVAAMLALVLPSLHRALDRIHVRGAGREVMMAFFSARAGAVAAGRRTAVVLDARGGRVLDVSFGETLLVRRVGAEHGVRVTATRDSLTYLADGLALGGANLSVVLSRGAVAETVIVSREGRVKLGARAR